MVEQLGPETNSDQQKKGKWVKAAKLSLGVLGGLSLLMGYISATGMKESEIEADARQPIDDFFAGINARDLERCRRALHYPHVQIIGSSFTILTSPDDFVIDFQALANDGWTYSTMDSCTMRHFCDDKVHFEIQFSMHQADDSRYATCQALWIITRQRNGWGIQCRSVFPAGSRIS